MTDAQYEQIGKLKQANLLLELARHEHPKNRKNGQGKQRSVAEGNAELAIHVEKFHPKI
jgi:hypothetical protein